MDYNCCIYCVYLFVGNVCNKDSGWWGVGNIDISFCFVWLKLE